MGDNKIHTKLCDLSPVIAMAPTDCNNFLPSIFPIFQAFLLTKKQFLPSHNLQVLELYPKLPKHENSKFDSSTMFHPIKSMYAIFTYNGWLILMVTVGIHIIYHTWMLWAYYCPSIFQLPTPSNLLQDFSDPIPTPHQCAIRHQIHLFLPCFFENL